MFGPINEITKAVASKPLLYAFQIYILSVKVSKKYSFTENIGEEGY